MTPLREQLLLNLSFDDLLDEYKSLHALKEHFENRVDVLEILLKAYTVGIDPDHADKSERYIAKGHHEWIETAFCSLDNQWCAWDRESESHVPIRPKRLYPLPPIENKGGE